MNNELDTRLMLPPFFCLNFVFASVLVFIFVVSL